MSNKASLKKLNFCNFKLETLLAITQEINKNLSVESLLKRYEYLLRAELNIGKVLIYSFNQKWDIILQSGVELESFKNISVKNDLLKYKEITTVYSTQSYNLKAFDVVIPIFHDNQPISYILIGDIDEEKEGISPTIKHLHYIQTLTNIIIVAIENKRLFTENLEQERIKKEMELASNMQAMLVPNENTLPRNSKISVSAFYLPHFDVGGDYYDFIKLSDEEIGFCIADVSGKGMSAALLMSNFQANIRALFTKDISLTNLVYKLNDRVNQSVNGEKYITLFVAKYNYNTNVFKFINSGHSAPLFYDTVEKKSKYLKLGSVGIGMLNEIPVINEGKLIIKNKSKILCYTDGLIELKYENKIKQDSKLVEVNLCNQLSIEESLYNLILEAGVSKSNNLIFDDITILGIELF